MNENNNGWTFAIDRNPTPDEFPIVAMNYERDIRPLTYMTHDSWKFDSINSNWIWKSLAGWIAPTQKIHSVYYPKREHYDIQALIPDGNKCTWQSMQLCNTLKEAEPIIEKCTESYATRVIMHTSELMGWHLAKSKDVL